ncbi:MAG: class I SAM-dependent methyltransferase [Draconibacterium sp.]
MNIYLKDTVAGEYDAYYTTPQGKKVDDIEKKIISDLMTDIPAGELLELGCGTAHWTQYLCEQGFQVTAIDTSDEMLKIARKKNISNAVFQNEDAAKLPFSDQSFSLIISITMLEFVDDMEAVFKEIDRLLLPGGYLVLGCLNSESELGKYKDNDEVFRHARFFSSQVIKDKMLRFGEPVLHAGVYFSADFEILDSSEKQNSVQPAFIGALVQKNKPYGNIG